MQIIRLEGRAWGRVWLTALHLCRWSLGYYLYLLKLSTPSGYVGGIVAIENRQKTGKPGPPASVTGCPTQALRSSCPTLSAALVAAQKYKSPKAPWGNRSWCLYRVLSRAATEVQVIIFCQLCMHYHCRWRRSSAVLQHEWRFSISTNHRGLCFGSKQGRGQLLCSTEKV